ncbi:MAG: glycosyltransferase family 2 protein [Candidatus Omnitrophica bacterium]|nr:glycosyltransferase family 2 protein [Candidatus Omnitrophota bacterium]
MKFRYSRYGLNSRDRVLERFLEVLPGAFSWTIIIGMGLLSWREPLIAAAIMVAFVLYWVLRLLYMNIFLLLSYIRLSVEKKSDWMQLVKGVDDGDFARQIEGCGRDIQCRLENFIRRSQLKTLQEAGQRPPKSEDIYHLVIIPVIRETRDVVEPGIESIANGQYPSKRVLVMIALEERAPDNVKEEIFLLQKKYQGQFKDFLVSIHPDGIQGEAKVKGANATWAARQAADYFQKHGIPYDNVIVSCFDADTVAQPEYLACLTYYFMITPFRTTASYQPIPVYHNNIWDVPSFARIIDIGTSFFQLVESTNPEKMVTFSSHSMSFKALVEVGYWPVDMISDDSAIFWKAFIHYDGNYQAVPIYTTVSMDIAHGRTHWGTFVSIYKQKRRWAWGVENLPIVMRAFLGSRSIPLYKRGMLGLRLFDSFVSWATWAFLLTFITWLPTMFAGKEFASTTVYYTAPRVKGMIFSLSLVGLLICMMISLLLLPRDKTRNFLSGFAHILEWIFIPGVILALSAIPALDAQTRLMFGRYMEFRVTEKYRPGK